MSEVTGNQPLGTPTWIDLGVPDVRRGLEFYSALFGWEYELGPADQNHYTVCTLRGKAVAGIAQGESTESWWNVYLATDDCTATAEKITAAGGEIVLPPMPIGDQGTLVIAKDPVGAQFGLWQGGTLVGCELVNEPGTLLRNDLVTPDPEPARAFYREVFGFTTDGNPDSPGLDFTFLRRPDGHEVSGVMGDPSATRSAWGTLIQVDDADAAVERARAAGGSADDAYDMIYGRLATVRDPFGATFEVGAPSYGDAETGQ